MGKRPGMTPTPQHQLRHETLTFLARAAKPKREVDLMLQVDALVDELERAWRQGSLEELQYVNDKARALATLAGELNQNGEAF
jgi:lysyl-tRNA synthetase class I